MTKWMISISIALLTMWAQQTLAQSRHLSASGHLFTVTTLGNSLTIRTTKAGQTYQTAGIKSLTAGFSFSNCTHNNNGQCVFTVSDTAPATLILSGPAVQPVLELSLNGTGGTYSHEKAYIGNRFAYVTNGGVANTIFLCPINSSTGLFGDCVDSGATSIDDPEYIVINRTGTFAYITNFSNNTVTLCSIMPNGMLSNCGPSGAGAVFDEPIGITLNKTGSLAYVSNQAGNTVSRCTVNTNGTLSACQDSGNTGVAFDGPRGLTINNTGSLAYVADVGGVTGNVSICPINLNGSYGVCRYSGNTGIAYDHPSGVVLNNVNNMAYVPNYVTPGFVSLCPITSDSSFGACTDSGVGSVFEKPSQVAFNSAGTLAYITNYGASPGTVSICSVSVYNGMFLSCSDSGNTFTRPHGLALF